MQFFAKHNTTIIRAGAAYDFIATVGFVPPFAAMTLASLMHLHTRLGLPGTMPVFNAQQLLFANLLGIIVIVWAMLRLIRPLPYYGFVDAIGRLGFISTMMYYVFALNVSYVLLGFAALEASWMILQLLGFISYQRTNV